MESLFSLCLLAVISLALAYPPASYFSSPSTPQCATNQPCRLIVRTQEGRYYTSSDICACANQVSCPYAWDAEMDRSATVNLNTFGRRELLLQMKYCQPVVPEELCEPDQVALHVTGMSIIPTSVLAYNCTCRNNTPLNIWNAWKQNHQFHQEFKCSNSSS